MKYKRISAAILASTLLLQSGALATEKPVFLREAKQTYLLKDALEARENLVAFPKDSKTFSYSFAGKDEIYSEFVITLQPYTATVNIRLSDVEESHALKLEIVETVTDKTVFKTELNAISKSGTSITPSITVFSRRKGYYIRLSGPTIPNASGTIQVDMVSQSVEPVLRAMKIINGYENGQYIPARNITRAEMCKMTAVLSGYRETAARQIFADVPENHWANPYIAFCFEKEIIEGTENALFGPEEHITCGEGLAMLVRAVGRAPEAETRGGYPGGYMMIAAREEITRGNDIIVDALMTRQLAANTVYNSLFVPLMMRDAKEKDEAYIVMDGKGSFPLDTFYLRFAGKYEPKDTK